MSESWRDSGVPYTKVELLELEDEFKLLQSYANESCGCSDFRQIGKYLMRLYYTEAQYLAFIHFCDTHLGGRLGLRLFMDCMESIHNTALFTAALLHHFDPQQTGYVPLKDFQHVFEFLLMHDGALAGRTMADFLLQVPVDAYSKVSIDECTQWIATNTFQTYDSNPATAHSDA